tara:strand:- start:380 stop:718 length:339 start_codon:yes stop_codon:yes gene_type:complete
MPPFNYCSTLARQFSSDEERRDYNRLRNKKHSQLFYWRQNYKFYFRVSDYEIIRDNARAIKGIVQIRHFVKYHYEIDKFYDNFEHQQMYSQNYDNLKKIDHILPLLKELEIN